MTTKERIEKYLIIPIVLFRMTTVILFLYTTGEILLQKGITENTFLTIYRFTVIIWAGWPLFIELIKLINWKRETNDRNNK